MKKTIFFICLICLFVLCSCKEKVMVESISISNPKTDFVLGQHFNTGRDCIIIANYIDGNKSFLRQRQCKFYLDEVPIKNLKFKKAGNFTVKAEYREASTQYNISVIDQGIIKRYNLFLIYYLIVNFITLIVFYKDKERAKNQEERISEFSLFFLAYAGGAIGAYTGMFLFSHKTRKTKFLVFIPIAIVIHIGIILLYKKYF